jgi:hypothetical protein
MADSLCDHCAQRHNSCPIEPEQPVTYCIEAKPRDSAACRAMQWIVATEPPARRAQLLERLIHEEERL